MEEQRLKAVLESLLFAAGEPVPLARLAGALEGVPRDHIKKALAEMTHDYGAGGHGLRLEEVAGGYQLRTPKEHALYVRRLLDARPPRLSRPLLETLAIIAYRQPVTRPEVEQLRGVDAGGVLDTLLERGLIRVAGRKEAPGRPLLYATSQGFLETFGLKDLDSLPDLQEFRSLEDSAALENSAADQAAAVAAESVGAGAAAEDKLLRSAPEKTAPADPNPAGGEADKAGGGEPGGEPPKA